MKTVFGIIGISTVLMFSTQVWCKNMRQEDEQYQYRACQIKISKDLAVDVNEMPFIRIKVMKDNTVLIKVKNKQHTIHAPDGRQLVSDIFCQQLQCQRYRVKRIDGAAPP